jgi:hypothetical protein
MLQQNGRSVYFSQAKLKWRRFKVFLFLLYASRQRHCCELFIYYS